MSELSDANTQSIGPDPSSLLLNSKTTTNGRGLTPATDGADAQASGPGLRGQIRTLIRTYEAYTPLFDHVGKLLDISDGDLLSHLEDTLRLQLSVQSYDSCRHRLAPINLLNKIVEKISKIYQPPPARRLEAEGGGEVSEADRARFEYYSEKFNCNGLFRNFAEMLTLLKSALIQPYLDKNGMPKARLVQNDHFFVMSDDKLDPMVPTHITTFARSDDGKGTTFTAYTDAELLIFNNKQEVDRQAMAALENPEGVNPYGALPFVYAASSKRSLMPRPDSDVLRMTLLVPVLLSDLNYAVMFQAFSIIYGINVDEESMKIAPNAFWRFKQDGTTDSKPQVGVIKPSVDITQVLQLIETELSLWMNSRGIRPGSVGKLTKDNFASGISKMIDEMDTVELRQTLVEKMLDVEDQFWDLILYKMHPQWLRSGELDPSVTGEFAPGLYVETVFNTQNPVISRGQLVADLSAERAAGFTTLDNCIKQLNPLMTDAEVADLVKKIEAEQKVIPAPTAQAVTGASKDASTAEQRGAGLALEASA